MQIDVVQLVRDGSARYEWHWITSARDELRLRIAVTRDAMRFDNIPALNWHREVVDDNFRFNGVRLPASAEELQQIADLVGAMLLTPRVIDLIWLQAGIRFNAVVNSGPPEHTIVADMGVTDLAHIIDGHIINLGGSLDDNETRLVDSVGKFWCLINGLGIDADKKLYGRNTACNYGWCSTETPKAGLTPGVTCWQRPGFKHPKTHLDPSQTIRLMYRRAELSRDEGQTWEGISLLEVAQDATLAKLVTHDEKPLKELRLLEVPELPLGGHIVVPPVTLFVNGDSA